MPGEDHGTRAELTATPLRTGIRVGEVDEETGGRDLGGVGIEMGLTRSEGFCGETVDRAVAFGGIACADIVGVDIVEEGDEEAVELPKSEEVLAGMKIGVENEVTGGRKRLVGGFVRGGALLAECSGGDDSGETTMGASSREREKPIPAAGSNSEAKLPGLGDDSRSSNCHALVLASRFELFFGGA